MPNSDMSWREEVRVLVFALCRQDRVEFSTSFPNSLLCRAQQATWKGGDQIPAAKKYEMRSSKAGGPTATFAMLIAQSYLHQHLQ